MALNRKECPLDSTGRQIRSYNLSNVLCFDLPPSLSNSDIVYLLHCWSSKPVGRFSLDLNSIHVIPPTVHVPANPSGTPPETLFTIPSESSVATFPWLCTFLLARAILWLIILKSIWQTDACLKIQLLGDWHREPQTTKSAENELISLIRVWPMCASREIIRYNTDGNISDSLSTVQGHNFTN